MCRILSMRSSKARLSCFWAAGLLFLTAQSAWAQQNRDEIQASATGVLRTLIAHNQIPNFAGIGIMLNEDERPIRKPYAVE